MQNTCGSRVKPRGQHRLKQYGPMLKQALDVNNQWASSESVVDFQLIQMLFLSFLKSILMGFYCSWMFILEISLLGGCFLILFWQLRQLQKFLLLYTAKWDYISVCTFCFKISVFKAAIGSNKWLRFSVFFSTWKTVICQLCKNWILQGQQWQ